jgi:DNA-binding beta-propeller fold protein YncE
MKVSHRLFVILAFPVIAVLTAAEPPSLRFEKVIGDVRGKCSDNTSVAVADDGTTFLLMRSGHVAVFDPQGKYLKTLETQFPWPAEFHYISARGKLLLQGACTQDYPWVYSATRKGFAPGSFNGPGLVVEDAAGTVYVADTGNKRVQIFSKGNMVTPSSIIAIAAGPAQLAVKDKLLAVASEDCSISLFEAQGNGYTLMATCKAGDRIRGVAFAPDGSLLIARSDSLKKYSIRNGVETALDEISTIAAPRGALWPSYFPGNGPLISGPDGKIYFAAGEHNKLLSLNPADDSMLECGNLPSGAKTIAFAPDGTLLVPSQDRNDLRIQRFKPAGGKLESAGEFSQEPFYGDPNVPVWGLLPDSDGSVYMRLLDNTPEKGWPAVAIKKISAAGKPKVFLDFGGSLYGKWTKFPPSGAYYSLKFDKDHNILFVATPLLGVYKVSTAGRILWKSGTEPLGTGEKIEFSQPRDVAGDSRGNVWVVDSEKYEIICLSPDGKLLMEYGTHGTMDDMKGEGFDKPSGISIAEVDGNEFLYVGDSGNQRIVKYQILHH